MFYIADLEGHPDAPKPGHVYVSVGSLTSPIPDAPVSHVSYEEKVTWCDPGDKLPKFSHRRHYRNPTPHHSS